MKVFIGSTRFNSESLNQNEEYKNKNNISGVIYGSQLKITSKCPINSILFVIEMNNDTNKINGIGLIRNNLQIDRNYNLYTNCNWNRYIYRGDYWISRNIIYNNDQILVEKLENCLFKGKGNVKRISGISLLTEKNYKKWELDELRIKNFLRNIFIYQFKQ